MLMKFRLSVVIATLITLQNLAIKVFAHHGYALATNAQGDRKTNLEWQLACSKEDLLTSDFYPSPSKEVTLSYWVRYDSGSSLSALWGISSIKNPNLLREFIYHATNTVEDKSSMSHMDGGFLEAISKLPQWDMSDWNHYTYVRHLDGKGFVYINGEQYVNQTSSSVSNLEFGDGTKWCNLCFGAYSQLKERITRERSATGAIDDFYLISRALTASEVKQLYQDSRYIGSISDVKIYYDFDTFDTVGGVTEIRNLGTTAPKYNLVMGKIRGNIGVVTDNVDNVSVNLKYPILTSSQTKHINDMGPSSKQGLVQSVKSGLTKLGPVPGSIKIKSLPASGVLKRRLGNGSYNSVSVGNVIDKDSLYIDIDWSVIGIISGTDKRFTFQVEYNSVVSTVVILDGSLAPVPAWQSLEVVEDDLVVFKPDFADTNGLSYSVSVESAASGATLKFSNGTSASVGVTISTGMNAIMVKPPLNYEGLLIDAFCFKSVNELGISQTTKSCVNMTVIPYNDLPVIQSATLTAYNSKNYTIDVGALVNDADGDVTSIAITKLPSKGNLFYIDGTPMSQEFRLADLKTTYFQSVSEVLNCSSFYSYGSYKWHVAQAIGARDVFSYGDSPLTWSPATKTGTGVSVDRSASNTKDPRSGISYYYGPFDHDAIFKSHSFTEYIEVKFSKAVYPSLIEIGMPRGMGSITAVYGMSVYGVSRPTGLSGPDRKWVKLFTTRPSQSIQEESAKFNKYYIYFEDVCNHAEKVDTLRIEMDTRAVSDWNEIDYIYLYGADELPSGILPFDTQKVIYVPHAHSWGEDEIKFNAYDCGYEKYSKAVDDASISITVKPSTNTNKIIQKVTVPQVRSSNYGTEINLLPSNIDAMASNPNRSLVITSIPPSSSIATFVQGFPLTAAQFQMPFTNSSLVVKPYTCNTANIPGANNKISYEYSDVVTGEKITGDIDFQVTCLTDLQEPCSGEHWSFTLSSCNSDNERTGVYQFSTLTSVAPKTLCCNSLNEDVHVCPTGRLLPNSFTVECDYIEFESDVAIGFIIINVLFIAMLLCFIGFIISRIGVAASLRMGQASLLITCYIGGIFGILTGFIYPGEWTTEKCRLLVAMPSLAFSMIFTSIVLKAWRIDAIFNNRTLLAVRIGFAQMFTRFAYIIGIDLVCIILFVFLNDVHATTHYKNVDGRQIQYKECTTDGVYMGYVLLLSKFLLLIYGVILAIRVRKVSQEFSDTRYIVYSIYSNAIVGIIGIYLYLFSDLGTETAYIIFEICLITMFTLPSVFMILPRILEIFFVDNDFTGKGMITNNGIATTGKGFALTTKGEGDSAWIDNLKDADTEQLHAMLAEQQEEITMLKVMLEQSGYRPVTNAIHPLLAEEERRTLEAEKEEKNKKVRENESESKKGVGRVDADEQPLTPLKRVQSKKIEDKISKNPSPAISTIS